MAEADAGGSSQVVDFLPNSGEMADLVRAKDWSATPLGPMEQWPQSLRTTVSLCLASNFPINIIWGPQHTQIYNDGYRVVCGEEHPTFLAKDYSVSWASAWPVLGGPFTRALAGETTFIENQRMFLHRNGYLEETFFTFSTSPIRDESGGIGGLFHPVTETTAAMLGARRTRAIRDMTATLGQARSTGEVFDLTVATLGEFAFDLPFLLLYRLVDPQASPPRYALIGPIGIAPGTSISPTELTLDTVSPWPLRALIEAHGKLAVSGLAAALSAIPCGPYDEPPNGAMAMPIRLAGTDLPVALIVAGVSPRLPLDDLYRSFYDLVSEAFAAAMASAHADEEERRRLEALAEIDRAKTAFILNVSHEFRTPLTLMLGPLADAMDQAGQLPPHQFERLQFAHRNSQRLLKLVNSLLDFSRIEAGRIQATFEPVDLAALTADVASNFRSACERAGLRLVVDTPSLGEPVHVDRDMWEKIVLNLLSNAFKFTLRGDITVRLARDASGVRLTVSDTGVGIPAAEMKRVFERFHRIEGQGGRTREGTGIGLALVDEILKLHGGTIVVDSVEGAGSTFTVTVPFGVAHLPQDRIRAARSLASTAIHANAYVEEALRWLPDAGRASDLPDDNHDIPPMTGCPRIVLADDNADMRAYVGRILAEGGYDVQTADNGVEALVLARAGTRPDMVLADVMMPGLDGFGLLQALRADPAMEGLLIILLSARAGEEARVEGLAAGADDYIVKPFSARELRARIDGAIKLASQRRIAAQREQDLRAQIALEQGKAELRDSEQRLAYALRAGRMGSWAVDLRTGTLVASDLFIEDLGLDPDAPLSSFRDQMERIVRPRDLERHRAAVRSAIDKRADLDVELRLARPNGETAWIQVRGRATYGQDGTPLTMAGVSMDVTARKRSEQRQKLLLNELNHRAKNVLATVQSIAMQTQRNARTPAEFNEDLADRISALALAHDLLVQESWDGALLGDVVDRTLQVHATAIDSPTRVLSRGPAVRLSPNATVTLNMAFHELAANAAKYGALSHPAGGVDVSWRLSGKETEAALEIVWRESGGPEVAPPARRGFGSRLIEHGVANELGGEVHLDFPVSGVCCHMRLPLSTKIAALN